ncbi:UNVERIFIED_CONTAM: Zeaxanthin epoxidase, chloroplastic [Sesamum radiatum]|uniref:Zeaxanthin epoxidase, chloroplastic n=1 Tax=Sesamum radiatum TaxID=300843 RepID=A0AAW2VMK5_SESRA
MASLQCLMSLNLCPHQPALRLHGFGQRRSSTTGLIFRVKCESRGSSYVDREAKGNEKKLKILVAGGGIAGLVFGLAAKRSGFDVKVFEKDLTAVRGEGRERGPIQLLSSALGLLEAIDKDVAREIMGAGHVTGDRNCGLADGRSGEWFVKFDFLTPAILKGIPITQMICRMELQRLLLNAVGEDVVINNSKVVDFANDANKVTVFLDNGQQYEGDLLVGADGLRSTVRSKLFGAHEPNYSNFICYTGVAEFDPQHLPHFGYKVFLGRNQFFVAADIGKGRLQWYAFVKEARQSPVSPTGIHLISHDNSNCTFINST